MPITENDIKLLASQRMTDTPDGGGRMTGTVVQSGVDNNLFDDVSNLDRVHGSVSLRKVFPWVLTNTTDKYLGSRAIIDEAPADPNVHCVLFDASTLFDTRSEAKARVEAYMASGAPYMGLLYGPHIAGMRVVSILQRQERGVPAIGEVLLLKKNIGLSTETAQFVRVSGTSAADFTFTDGQGDFVRSVVTCDISDPLRTDFTGFEAVRIDSDLSYTGKARLFSTVVADAAQYFGIRPLQVAAAAGDFNIKADSAYTPLLPSAQIESPVTDASAAGFAAAAIAVGDAFVLTGTYTLTTTQSLHVGGSVAPGTLVITPTGRATPLTDNAGGALMCGSAQVGAFDYANGLAVLSDAAYAFTGVAATLAYKVAATPQAALRSTSLHVSLQTRGLNWVATLPTPPAPGTTVVSYMAGGRWYVLRDNGAGGLAGAVSGIGAGSVNYTTCSVTATLGALPDVGSDVIVHWAEAYAAMSVSAASLAVPARLFWEYTHGSASVVSAALSVTWHDGSARSATCTNGVWTGDGTGTVADGRTVRFSPNTLPPAGTVFTVNANMLAPSSYSAANIQSGSVGAAVSPGSFSAVGIYFLADYTTSGTCNGAEVYIAGAAIPGAAMAWQSSRHASGTLSGRTVRDDGVGNLYIEFEGGWLGSVAPRVGRINVGTLNYTTGAFALANSVTLADADPGPTIGLYKDGGTAQVPWSAVPLANRSAVFTSVAQAATVNYQGTVSTPQAISVVPTAYWLALQTVPAGKALRHLAFQVGATRYVQDSVLPGQLLRDVSAVTGMGMAAGAVDVTTGRASVASWVDGVSSAPTAFAAALLSSTDAASEGNSYVSERIVLRTQAAPLRPGSFSVQGTLASGDTFSVTADADGKLLSASVLGFVNYQTGVCTLHFREVTPLLTATAPSYVLPSWLAALTGVSSILVSLGGVRTSTVRYNAVAYTHLPLDADILGLDPVRLPSDGRVPVFKAGRVVVVHNTVKRSPQTVGNGTVVDCGRTRLARIRVFGADGLEITSGFTRNLDAGTITFTNVAGYSQPVVVEHRIEDEALCAEAQITGDLRLTRRLTHDFPAGTSYVSSALVKGTLQAAAQDSFSQETWTNVWSDSRIGVPILAQYNDTTNPIAVTNAGAITERWLLRFTNNTEFSVAGEEVGQIITGNTATVLAPVNPATGVPYFTLQPAGWGSGWVAGNVLRLNTVGAGFPLWVARTVMQSPSAPPGSDQMTVSIRGDIDQ